PLPPGWSEGLAGPRPSESGYYVLGTFVPTDSRTAGTVLIAAQDMFFAAKPGDSALAAIEDTRRVVAATDGMSIDRGPGEVTIAGRRFARLDFSGAGIYRALFTTAIRCHLLSFVVTVPDAELREKLVLGLAGMTIASDAAFPVCRKDYASKNNVIREVVPPGGGAYARVPVRILVGADGRVRHIHVIRAAPAQKSGIEEALTQWLFKPYETDGSAISIETGVMFELKPAAGSTQKNR
ncbi:MAG TPA: hypothetical protein VEU47_19850, partial [Candidatus Cybelea sp.]|nr:hypothetical protein [Candidatus Cybelea sp.]